jgi:hypothetical protein
MLVQINKRSKLTKIRAKLFEVATERIEHKIALLEIKNSILATDCTTLMPDYKMLIAVLRCCVACMTA